MNHEELQHAYALDELLHPEGKPWEWWEVNIAKPCIDGWVDICEADTPIVWDSKIEYHRKSTAPDWSQALSPKEVAECDDWPEGYRMGSFGGHLIIDYHNCEEPYTVWNQHIGFVYDLNHQRTLLDHFKKRREAALATPTKLADCDPKPSKDEILRDEAIARFTEKATSKFNAGIQEHNPNGGNDLEDRATFADLEDEIIDLWYYVQGLKRRIHRT